MPKREFRNALSSIASDSPLPSTARVVRMTPSRRWSWRIEGRSVASKSYPNEEAFVDEVLAPFNARLRDRPSTRSIRAVYADGDAVVVLWDGPGVARDGQPYENSYAWFLVMRDGKVVDGTAFFDASAFNDLWSRVDPR